MGSTTALGISWLSSVSYLYSSSTLCPLNGHSGYGKVIISKVVPLGKCFLIILLLLNFLFASCRFHLWIKDMQDMVLTSEIFTQEVKTLFTSSCSMQYSCWQSKRSYERNRIILLCFLRNLSFFPPTTHYA